MRGLAILSAGAVMVTMVACGGASSRVPASLASTAPKTAPKVATATGASAESFSDLFDRTCVSCHSSTKPPMPDFTREMSPDLLALALNRLTGREMPPRDFKGLDDLTDKDRETLVYGLCRKTSRSHDVCREMAMGAVHPDVMRPGSVITQVFDENGVAPVPSPLRDLVANPDGSGGNTGSQYSLRRPGTVALVVLSALNSCRPEASKPPSAEPAPPASPPSKQTPMSAEERRRCVEKLLQVGLGSPVPVQ